MKLKNYAQLRKLDRATLLRLVSHLQVKLAERELQLARVLSGLGVSGSYRDAQKVQEQLAEAQYIKRKIYKA